MGNFSNEVIQQAKRVEAVYNVPASVTLGAYALESGYGSSSLAKNNNNYFGITGSGNAGHTLGNNGRKWAKYSSMEESFNAFGKLLSNTNYSALTVGSKNVSEYVNAYSERYAPTSDGNSGYAQNLLKIISDNNLTQYDSYNWETNAVSGDLMPETSSVENMGFFEKWGFKLIYIIVCTLIIFLAVYFVYKSFSQRTL